MPINTLHFSRPGICLASTHLAMQIRPSHQRMRVLEHDSRGAGEGVEEHTEVRGLLFIGLHLHQAVSQLQDGCRAIASTHSSHTASLLDAEGREGCVRHWQGQHWVILLQEEVPDVQQPVCAYAEEHCWPAIHAIPLLPLNEGARSNNACVSFKTLEGQWMERVSGMQWAVCSHANEHC